MRRHGRLAGGVAVLLGAAAPACSFDGQAIDRDAPAGDDAPPVIDAVAPTVDAVLLVPDAPVPVPDAALPVDASLPDARPCREDYVQLPGQTSWYRVEQATATWTAAEADCEDDGAGTHLVIVDSAAEYGPINDAFFGQLWVGLSDRVTEGAFLTVTGVAPPYLPWSITQPDDFFGQDCVRFGDGGGVDDIDCTDDPRGYVCECDGVAADPAAY